MINLKSNFKIAIEISEVLHIPLPELLAFLTGIKPMINRGIQLQELPYLEKYLKNYLKGIFVAIGEGHTINRGQQSYFIVMTNNQKAVDQGVKDYQLGQFDKVGKNLGYPSCCIIRHLKTVDTGEQLNQNKIIFDTVVNSKKCYWQNNHLFNFTTRLNTDRDLEDYENYHKLNTGVFGINLQDLENIFHIPCCFDCSKSLNIGIKVAKLMKQYFPKEQEIIEKTLKRPILFWDKFEWILFDGQVKNNTIKYTNCVPPWSLVSQEIVDKIQQGNKLICDKEKIKVFKDNKTIWVYKKKSPSDGFLINFQ